MKWSLGRQLQALWAVTAVVVAGSVMIRASGGRGLFVLLPWPNWRTVGPFLTELVRTEPWLGGALVTGVLAMVLSLVLIVRALVKSST